MRKKVLSILLVTAMTLSMLPTVSLAAGGLQVSDIIGYWYNEDLGLAVNLSDYYEWDDELCGVMRKNDGTLIECGSWTSSGDPIVVLHDNDWDNKMYCHVELNENAMTLSAYETYGSIEQFPGSPFVLTRDTSIDAAAPDKIGKQEFTAEKESDGSWTLTMNGSLGTDEAWVWAALTADQSDAASEWFEGMNQYLYASADVLGNTTGIENIFSDATLSGVSSETNVFTIDGSAGVSAIFAARADAKRIDVYGNKYMLHAIGGAPVGETDNEVQNQFKDTVTLQFNWNGRGPAALPTGEVQIQYNGNIGDLNLDYTDADYEFICFLNPAGSYPVPITLDTPLTADAALTAVWAPKHPTLSLTWKDSMGNILSGAPTNYEMDFTAFIATYKEALKTMNSGAMEDAMDDVCDDMLGDLRNYLYYNDEEPDWDISCGAQGTERKSPYIVCSYIVQYLMNDASGNYECVLQRSEGYDTVTVQLYYDEAPVQEAGFESLFTIEGKIDPAHEPDYAALKSKMEDGAAAASYLPAALYKTYDDYEEILAVAKTAADLEESLGLLGEYCYEDELDDEDAPVIRVVKYDDPVIGITWLDAAEQPLDDKAYPASYTMPMTDYYAAKTNEEKVSALDVVRQDFDDKLGEFLSWDDGFGTWDFGAIGAYESFVPYYIKLTSDELFDLISAYPPETIALRRYNDSVRVLWDEASFEYNVNQFYVSGSAQIDTDQWKTQYAGDLSEQLASFAALEQKLYAEYTYIDNNDSDGIRYEYGYICSMDELSSLMDGLLQNCRENGLVSAAFTLYEGTNVSIHWYDKNGETITGLPETYSLDLSLGASECGEKFFGDYSDILSHYARFVDFDEGEVDGYPVGKEFDDPFTCIVTNSQDVMSYIASEADYSRTTEFFICEYNGEYTFQGDTAYLIGINEYEGDKPSVDMWGYYNYRWLTTTYDNDGYCLETSGLGNANVDMKVTVANGKNLMLTFKVTAAEAIENGKIGIWTDIMVGDNDSATVRTVFDEAGNKIGFELLDDGWHYDGFRKCPSYNAKYTCYVAGTDLKNAAKKILGIKNPVEGKVWYGDYSYADTHCFEELNASTGEVDDGYYNDDYTALYKEDSGAAAHWDVNLAAGESLTYCVAFGVIDASMNVAPRFIGSLPQFGEEGFVTVDIANLIPDGSSGHNIVLALDTSIGMQLDAGKATLYRDPSKLFTVDPDTKIKNHSIEAVSELFTGDNDEYNDNDQVAQFIVSVVNSFPDTYVITGLTATNDGGEIAEYVLKDHNIKNFTMTIPSTSRTTPLFLNDPETTAETENLKEGWSYNKENGELTVHSLDITTGEGHESESAISLPAGTDVVVESFNDNGAPGENKIASAGSGIEFAEGSSGGNAIAGDGKLSVIASETGIVSSDELTVSAETKVEAKTGIKCNDDVVISGNVNIKASELGIKCETLTIEDGAVLTINVDTGAELLNVSGIVIPDGYELIGGKVEDGVFTPDDGATQLIIRKKPSAPKHHSFDTSEPEYVMMFEDVPEDSYYYEAIKWAASNKITNGITDVMYAPDIAITRAQAVTYLWRAAGCPEPVGTADKFFDVPADEYYSKAVAWAIEQGITKGITDIAFCPYQICTRGQIVTFLARFAGVQDTETDSGFMDVNPQDYFAAAIKWAKEHGVAEGYLPFIFSPYELCTRAQAVAFLSRWLSEEHKEE